MDHVAVIDKDPGSVHGVRFRGDERTPSYSGLARTVFRCFRTDHPSVTSKATRLRALRLNSTPTMWIGTPR